MALALPAWLQASRTNYRTAIALRHGRANLVVCKTTEQGIQLVVNDEQQVEGTAYARAIELLLDRYQRLGLKKSPTHLVLSPKLVQQTTMERPQLNDDEIRASLHWSLKELIDIPATDLVADFYPPGLELPGQERIHVVAVQKSWLSKVIQPIVERKLNLQGVVNEDLALMSMLPRGHKPMMVVTQYEQHQAQLLLASNGTLVVSRQLKPLQSLTKAAPLDAYEAESLAIELQRSMDYFSGQLRQAPLQVVCLALPGQHTQALADILQQNLSVEAHAFAYPDWAGELAAGDFSDIGALAGVAYGQAVAEGAEG